MLVAESLGGVHGHEDFAGGGELGDGFADVGDADLHEDEDELGDEGGGDAPGGEEHMIAEIRSEDALLHSHLDNEELGMYRTQIAPDTRQSFPSGPGQTVACECLRAGVEP